MGPVRWALLTGDGRLVEGVGRPDFDLHALALTAVAGVFNVPKGGPSIYVAGGPDLLWTVERVAGSNALAATYWGIALPAGARLWVSPRGMIGIGQSLEDVERAFLRLVEAEALLRAAVPGG